MQEEYTQDTPIVQAPLYAADFHTSDEAKMKEFAAEYTPALNRSEFLLCQTAYRKDRRAPSFEELALINEVVRERRSSADHRLISHIRIASPAIAETYRDLIDKLAVLEPKRKLPPSLADLLSVSGRYMRRIGRDAVAFSKERIPLMWKPADPSENRSFPKEGDAQAFPLPLGAALILLSPAENELEEYERNTERFLSELRAHSPRTHAITVSRFGLIGLFVSHCQGIIMNPLTLTADGEDDFSFSTLTRAYRGLTVLAAPKEQVEKLTEYASRFGLVGSYFAKNTATGRIRGPKEHCPVLDLSLPLLRALAKENDFAKISVEETVPLTVCSHLPITAKTATGEPIFTDEAGILSKDGYLFAPVWSKAESDCFGVALGTAIDALLSLIARGADRRQLGLSLRYSFPRAQIDEEILGQDVALILGAYRLTMELALPEEGSTAVFSDGDRSLLCCAYAPVPNEEIPSRFVRIGSAVRYLPVRCAENGMPDFDDLRRICDDFHRLCEQGLVRSARAVSGDPLAVMEQMSEGGSIRPSARVLDGGAFLPQGILCEASPSAYCPSFEDLGIVVSVRSDEISKEESEDNDLKLS